jgi:hypothetical protein
VIQDIVLPVRLQTREQIFDALNIQPAGYRVLKPEKVLSITGPMYRW